MADCFSHLYLSFILNLYYYTKSCKKEISLYILIGDKGSLQQGKGVDGYAHRIGKKQRQLCLYRPD